MRRSPAPQHSMDIFVVRIGHAEREATVEVLAEHHVQGRLSVEELDRRQSVAMESVTQAELTALVADLPPLARVPARTPGRRPRRPATRSTVRDVVRSPARWLLPPAAVSGTAAVYAANTYYDSGQTLMAGLVCGAVGMVGTWWAARSSRPRD